MGLEELAVILMTNLLECYIWNLFMRNFFDYRSMPVLTRNMARFGIVAVMSLINLVGSPPLNLAGILTVYTAAAYILFEGNRGRLFYFNILETLLLLFCEDVVVSLGGNSEGAFLILDITAGKIAMLMVAKLFSLLLVYLVIRLMQGKLKNKEASVPLPFLLCPVLSIMLIRVVWQVTILFNGGNFGRGKADAHYHLYAGGCFQYCNPGDLQPERSDAVPDNGTAADAAAGQDGIGKLYAAGTGYAELQADPA